MSFTAMIRSASAETRQDGFGYLPNTLKEGLMTKAIVQLKIINRLHVFRAEKRITQDQLAKEIGVTRATIIAIEKGSYNPSLELAFRLARFFKTEIPSIFSVEEEAQ